MNNEANSVNLIEGRLLGETRQIRQKLYQRLWDRLGPIRQLGVAIEELSELAKELSRAIEDEVKPDNAEPRTSKERIVDEVTDVSIILEELIYYYNIEKEVHKRKGEKLLRTDEFLRSLDK